MDKKTFTMVFVNKSKIHFESKSQPEHERSASLPRCLSINQRYILKANHNTISICGTSLTGVCQ